MQSAINRRTALAGLAALGVGGTGLAALGARPGVASLWPRYRQRFVMGDGRVIDTYNKNISHSESQGWGLLLAAAAGDWPTFDRIWSWTEKTLLWAGAPLFAWRWDPAKNQVTDHNDASDGDILVAWALARAGVVREQDGLTRQAALMAEAVRRLVLAEIAGGLALLPGFYGFESDRTATVNLSYYVFPAFGLLGRVDPDPAWARLNRDGVALARRARFGRYSLVPDWMDATPGGQLAPAAKWPARFGFDAIRVPLYLWWAGHDSAADLDVYRRAWASDPIPAWFALDGGPNAEHAASAGVSAMRDVINNRWPAEATVWQAVDKGEYYAASLAMLSLLAAEERRLR